MQTFAHDIRYGARLLLRAPGFTLLAAALLALGIGALSAVFSVVDATLLRPLPFAQPDDLVMLWEKPGDYAHNRVSPLNFQDWHDQNSIFAAMAAVSGSTATLQSKDGPEQLTGQGVTSEFFSVLGIRPLLGRDFTHEDEVKQENVALISESLWRQRFGADPKVLGSTLSVNGKPTSIIGVFPAQFAILWKSDFSSLYHVKRSPEQRKMHYLAVLGRLKPGVSLSQAQAGMDVIADNLARNFPNTNKSWGINVEPLRNAMVSHDVRITTLALFGIVGFVLLMACANVANLILARGAGRSREMAVRAALGAGSARLTRQLLTESMLLALFGGIGGVMLAWTLVRLAPALLPHGALPVGLALTLDVRVLAFALFITLLTGLIFGLAPVWQLARRSVAAGLQSGGSYTVVSGNTQLLGGIAALQIAVGVMIVSSAILLIRTLERLGDVDPGFHAEHVLTMAVSLPQDRYPTPSRALQFYESVQKEITALPGVRAASFGTSLPTDGWNIGQGFEVVGDPPRSESESPAAHYQMVGAQYFEALGISLDAGRFFDEHDTATAPQVAIVNQEFVRHYLHAKPPIGMHIRVQAMDPGGPKPVEREIVGVINQVKVDGLGEKEPAPEVYVPITQNAWFWSVLAVRTTGDPFALLTPVKTVIAKYDPQLPVTNVRSMEDVTTSSIATPRFRAQALGSFSILALLLSAMGIFGVQAFAVAQRRREFGIRLALGAQVRDVFLLVFGAAGRIVAIGLIAGGVGAATLARSFSALLFGVRPLDAVTFITAPLTLVMVAIVATVIPALHAIRTDPAVVLRQD